MDINTTATAAQVSIIRRFDSQLWLKGERRPQQGELRGLRDGGFAVEHPDHSFTLTERGRTVLSEARRVTR